MNTQWMLMAEFETPHIPLRRLCEKYLSMSLAVANRKAGAHELPFPCFRSGSTKSEYLVSIADLAAYLDAEREKANQEWRRVNC